MSEDKDYIIDYYYDIKAKLWRADVLDEESNVVEYVNSYREPGILEEIKDLKKKYTVLRVTKTKFYK